MELYTLDAGFRKDVVIDQFVSSIWTERYSAPGDVVLEVEPSSKMVNTLAEGTFLALDGSQEVMIVDTLLVENGKLKVTGKSLLDFLNHRIIRSTTDHEIRSWIVSMPAGQMIAHIVNIMCILGSYPTPATEAAYSVIPNLSIGEIDMTDPYIRFDIPFGPAYDPMKTIADTYEIGMSLYLNSASVNGYSLKFKSYRGRDLTSDQTTYPLVRFSTRMDTLTDVKELRSISGFKTHCWAYAPQPELWMAEQCTGFAYAPGAANLSGFNRRVMQIWVEDLDTKYLTAIDPQTAINVLAGILHNAARNALANNNYTRVVDGEVVPQNEFRFGTHYLLGDIIELQGQSEIVQKARITEYIRSQDATGERSYPTVSLID